MKRLFLTVLLTLGLVFGGLASNALAGVYQCDVVGNSYTLDLDGVEYTLESWTDVCTFGPCPECGGKVYLMNSLGQFWVLNWTVDKHTQQLSIEGVPAVLTKNGLTVYFLPAGLHRTKIGQIVYMTEEEIPTLVFAE